MPALPPTLGSVVGWIIREVLVGLAIGAVLRSFMTAMVTAGEIVSMQTTLGFSQTANPMQASPGSTISAFLTLLGITLIFATNTHHLFIAGIVAAALIAALLPAHSNAAAAGWSCSRLNISPRILAGNTP